MSAGRDPGARSGRINTRVLEKFLGSGMGREGEFGEYEEMVALDKRTAYRMLGNPVTKGIFEEMRSGGRGFEELEGRTGLRRGLLRERVVLLLRAKLVSKKGPKYVLAPLGRVVSDELRLLERETGKSG